MTQTPKHTPGPWTVTMHGKAAYVRINVGKADLPPSATGYAEFSIQPYVRPAEAGANARLIASAPDLLAALEEIVSTYADAHEAIGDMLGRRWSANGNPVIQRARAAIARATGREG